MSDLARRVFGNHAPRRPPRLRPSLEELEDRTVPSTLVVLGQGSAMQRIPIQPGEILRGIESQVAVGGTHGAPMVTVRSADNNGFYLLQSTEAADGTIHWGSPMWAQALGDGGSSGPQMIDVSLIRTSTGAAQIVGYSTIDGSGMVEATSWLVSASGTSLDPTGHGLPPGTLSTELFGGDPNVPFGFVGHIAGAAAFDSPTGVQVLPHPGFSGAGLAFGRFDGTIGGMLDGKAVFWKLESGTFALKMVQLPSWSDGTGAIQQVTSRIMAGYLYDPQVDDVVPVIWDLNGNLLETDTSLAGYQVTRAVDNNGSWAVLFNSPTFDESMPSYLEGEGWGTPQPVFGPGGFLPGPAPGGSLIARSMSDGGSLWFGVEGTDGAGQTTFYTTSLLTQADPPHDTTPPGIQGITLTDANPTGAAVLHYQVSFTESVTGVDATDFSVVTTGTVGASISDVSGSGASYVVTVLVPTGQGTVALELANNGSIADLANNALTGSAVTSSPYSIQRTSPSVTGVGLVDPATNSLADVHFSVTFSQGVTGVDASDFAVAKTGSVAATVTSVVGSGSTYTVTVHIASGTGQVGLNVVNDHTIVNGFQIPLSNTFTGPKYTVDHTSPTAVFVINGGQVQRSMVSSVTITFSKIVTLPPNPASAFTLVRQGSNTSIALHATVSNAGGHTTVVLTFNGNGTYGGSLIDGGYTLSIVANKVKDTGGNTLIGTTSTTLFRVFGDLTGDGRVDLNEVWTMINAYGSHVGQTRYVAALDYDGNGRIMWNDLLADVVRYLVTIRVHGPVYPYASIHVSPWGLAPYWCWVW